MRRNLLLAAGASVALLACVAGRPTAAAPCVETLAPTNVTPVSEPALAYASSVAWRDDRTLLISARSGIVAYDLISRTATPLVAGVAPPSGLPRAIGLDSDGKDVVAFNLDQSDLAADAHTGRVVTARRDGALQIADVAVHAGTAAILGFPFHLKTSEFAQLWIGKPGAPWTSFHPLHPISEAADEIVRYAVAPLGGAVTFARDGTIAMISPAEPGVFRYRVDGTPLPTLGAEIRELVVPRMREATFGYRLDYVGRYREILNKQPLIDDLVDTPDGLAIVVRRWSEGAVHWELWFPGPRTVRRRVALGLQDPGVAGGHLHCSTRGPRLACTYGTITPPDQPWTPQLALFDLRSVTRSGTCR